MDPEIIVFEWSGIPFLVRPIRRTESFWCARSVGPNRHESSVREMLFFSMCSDTMEGLESKGGATQKKAGGKHTVCTHLTGNGTFRRANQYRQYRELRTPSLVTPITKQKLMYKRQTCCHWTNTGIHQERRRCIVCRQLKKARNQGPTVDTAGDSSTVLSAGQRFPPATLGRADTLGASPEVSENSVY